MSHYPSTQELAAFRRSIAHDPRYLDTIRWQDERGHGIGYRIPLQDHDSGILSTARREASALRSRAAALTMTRSALTSPYAINWERERGIPACIGDFSYGVISSDTWTEDEPRHPLPIRYQPAFTIG